MSVDELVVMDGGKCLLQIRGVRPFHYTICQDMKATEFSELFASVGWNCPTEEQMSLAIHNSTKSFIVRHKGKAVVTINWLGDYGMHWFMKKFIVSREFQAARKENKIFQKGLTIPLYRTNPDEYHIARWC